MKRTILTAALLALFGSGSFAHEWNGEDRLDQLMRELERLKAEIAKLKAERKAKPAISQRLRYSNEGGQGGHMVFFRGGYARMSSDRAGEGLPDAFGLLGKNDGQNGWYVGAGFDFSLTPNFFGLGQTVGSFSPGGTDLVTDFLNRTEVLAELMFEYKRFAQVKGEGGITPLEAVASGALIPPIGVPQDINRANKTVTITQFTLTAAPKLKFLRGSVFRPWIIPVGFALHVISPPSDGVTVHNPGLMFGAGFDLNVWKNIYVGGDFRYHVTPDEEDLGGIDGVDTDGFTAGGYVGIGF